MESKSYCFRGNCRAVVVITDNETLAHHLWPLLQVVDPKNDKNRQIVSKYNCNDVLGHVESRLV